MVNSRTICESSRNRNLDLLEKQQCNFILSLPRWYIVKLVLSQATVNNNIPFNEHSFPSENIQTVGLVQACSR